MSVIPPPVSRLEFKIQYLLAGTDISTLGIYIKESSGLLDKAKRKIQYRHDWDDENGEEVDLTTFVVDAREFRFDCFVVGETITDALEKMDSLFALTDTAGVKTLEVYYYGSTKKLTFSVYREDSVKVVKKFRYLKNVWTFTLILKEHIA